MAGEAAAGTRARILDAATALLGAGSYASTSISAICARSGLPPTSIYWHFGSKEGLLAAVMEEGAERWFQSTFEWETPSGGLLEGLSAKMDQLVGLLMDDPPFLRVLVMLALERRHIDKACMETVRRVRKRAIDRLVRWFATAFPSKSAADADAAAVELATFALTVFDGVVLAYQIDPKKTDLRRLLDQLRESLLALAAARGAVLTAHGSTSPAAPAHTANLSQRQREPRRRV
ncbi:MAG: TetR/AcrR family transcriptional regulator [Deltaproteobacteria bacterium]|nr:TetR/AcrR family transcriptional regulator [Deltaproteobacteria bacterium]